MGFSGFPVFFPSTVPFCGAWNGRGAGAGVSFGTLLGPEATGLFFPVTEGRRAPVGVRLLFPPPVRVSARCARVFGRGDGVVV
jgi:hypothetical protein